MPVSQQSGERRTKVQHLNPPGLNRNPAYTQAIVIPPGSAVVVVGGQNAVDAQGAIVGKGDLGAQTAKAVANVLACLEAAGTTIEQLIRVRIAIVGDADIRPGFAAWMQAWGNRPNPPTVSMTRVLGLAHPDFLVEIEAEALVP
jgi:enamine deaminase RidA (YjgF/YER057c/UK114 family)